MPLDTSRTYIFTPPIVIVVAIAMASLGLNDQLLSQVAQLAKLPAVKAVATALVALGLLPRLSSVLTRRKVNNYLADKTWNWKKEIVVVTGGSSGIGAELVTKLAKRGVKVIIVDMNEPRGKLGMSRHVAVLLGPKVISLLNVVRIYSTQHILLSSRHLRSRRHCLHCRPDPL